jgi:hypothetical protein
MSNAQRRMQKDATERIPPIRNSRFAFRNSSLSHSLGDRLVAGKIDILFAVTGNRTIG